MRFDSNAWPHSRKHQSSRARLGAALLLALTISLVGNVAPAGGGSAAAASAPKTRRVAFATKGPPPTIDATTGRLRTATDKGGRCAFGACYFYNAMSFVAPALGASVLLSQARPVVDSNDDAGHSLAELAVQSADQKQTVEVGWIVNAGDPSPRLFVFHWVDGNPTCYNGCGFVPVSKKYHAGDKVVVGEQRTFSIQFKNGKWLVGYHGETLGYFPQSLWKTKFSSIGVEQAFGEVSSSSATTPHSDMGNGVLGSAPKSAAIRKFKLVGGTSPDPAGYSDEEAPSVYAINPYDVACTRSCGMTFGGPGY